MALRDALLRCKKQPVHGAKLTLSAQSEATQTAGHPSDGPYGSDLRQLPRQMTDYRPRHSSSETMALHWPPGSADAMARCRDLGPFEEVGAGQTRWPVSLACCSAAAASDGTPIPAVLLIRRAIFTAKPMARTGEVVGRSSGSRQVRRMRVADAHNATTLVNFVVHEVARGQTSKTLSSSLILGDKLQRLFGQPILQLATARLAVHRLHDADSPGCAFVRRLVGNNILTSARGDAGNCTEPARECVVRQAHVRATGVMPQQAASLPAYRISGCRIDSCLGQLLEERPCLQYGPSSFVWRSHCGRASPFNAVPACSGSGQ